jgi:L-lactate dehydrogenase complex protein LldF
MGSVLTPLLTSLENSAELPNACTACGRCEEVCPAAIPLPDLLRDLRSEAHAQGISARRWRFGLAAHAWLARHPRLYRWLTGLAAGVMHRLGRRSGQLTSLPLAAGWLSARDLPAPARRTFLGEMARTRR